MYNMVLDRIAIINKKCDANPYKNMYLQNIYQ